MKKAMNQSTITRMLNLGSVLLTLVAILLFIFSASKNKSINTQNDDRFNLIDNAYLFMNASTKLTSDVHVFSVTGDQTYYNSYMKEVEQTKDRETGVANMQAIGLTSEEKVMIDEMMSLSNQLVPLEKEAMAKAQAGATSEATALVFGPEYENTVTRIKSLQTDFLNSLSERSARRVKELKAEANVMQTIAVLFLVTMAVLQLVSLAIVDRKLLKPLGLIKDEMEEISKGNLSNPVQLEADTSEIGTLVYAIQTTKQVLNSYIHDIAKKLELMASGDMRINVDLEYIGDFQPIKVAMQGISASLRDTMMQIQAVSDQVLAGANQVAIGAQSLAQGSTEQASTLEELSSSFSEVSDQVKSNAKYSKQAEDMAEGATQAIAGSNQKMQDLMDAMEEVSKHSSQISQIIKSIEDIAFQTNILALNAAVEAARAGSAGKGFAVVADEVRNLAGKSAVAASNTAQMIENTVQAVNNGMTITRESVEDLHNLVESAQKTMELVREVSKGSQVQANKISDVELGVEQITSVVQTNSATSEESAATAEELSSQANLMGQMIAKFKV